MTKIKTEIKLSAGIYSYYYLQLKQRMVVKMRTYMIGRLQCDNL